MEFGYSQRRLQLRSIINRCWWKGLKNILVRYVNYKCSNCYWTLTNVRLIELRIKMKKIKEQWLTYRGNYADIVEESDDKMEFA